MLVELWPIERVKPYFRNPRVNDSAVDAVAASLKEFGWRQPVVVDAEGVIVVGHTRWKAAKKLGLAQVPVHIATDLSPEQIQAYRIADNQTATIAEWDKELLPLELADLREANFDLGLLGFSDDELAKSLQPVQEGQCDPDDVPAPPDKAVTQTGDLILLGEHRLLFGDSSNPFACKDFPRRPTGWTTRPRASGNALFPTWPRWASCPGPTGRRWLLTAPPGAAGSRPWRWSRSMAQS
jgi:hypothetical protein